MSNQYTETSGLISPCIGNCTTTNHNNGVGVIPVVLIAFAIWFIRGWLK